MYVEIEHPSGIGMEGAASDSPPMRMTGASVSRIDDLRRLEDDEFDASREAPREDCLLDEIPAEDLRWAAAVGLDAMPRSREGAAFLRIAEDVFVIPIAGGQFLHEDRHLADLDGSKHGGFSEHGWNLVVHGSEEQLLLCEVLPMVYEHFRLDRGALIYMNTLNRHAVSRKSACDRVVIVQVDGYGPDDRDAAVERIRSVLAARPVPTAV